MGVVLVLLKSYMLFIHLLWMQVADLPLAVTVALLIAGVLAVMGGVRVFRWLADRYHFRWRRTFIGLGCFLLFGVLTSVSVFTSLAPFAPLIFAPFIVLGGRDAWRAWRHQQATGHGNRRSIVVGLGLLIFLFDLELYALRSKVNSLERQFDSATFEIKAAKHDPGQAAALDFGGISAALVERFLGFRASFDRVAPPIVVARLTRGGSEPMAAHLAIIDLTAPGISVLITPERGPKTLTSDFATQQGAIVAINGEAGVSPSMDAELREWTGNWIVKGKPILLEDSDERPFMSFDVENHGRYYPAPIVDREVTPEKYNTIWGRWDLLVEGKPGNARGFIPRARTAMALDAAGKRLYLLQVDGDQSSYSLGLTLDEARDLLSAFGATDAMSCDEGGSSAMWVRDQDGITGRPADGRRERPIYTHFGIGYSAPGG